MVMYSYLIYSVRTFLPVRQWYVVRGSLLCKEYRYKSIHALLLLVISFGL